MLSNISAKIYRTFGSRVSFMLAMSPIGKSLFKLYSLNKPDLVKIKTKYGFFIKVSKHDLFFSGYFFLKETNPQETKLLREILKEGDTFVDVGAHIGWYALSASGVVKNKGRVIAFEPNPACVSMLNENCRINRFKNINIEKVALSDKAGTFDFWTGDSMGGSFVKENTDRLSDEPTKKIRVKTNTFDNYCKEKDIKSIKMIKIDVEGFELEVLKGAAKMLKKYSPDLIIEVIEESLKLNNSSKKKLLGFLEKIKYKPYLITNSGIEKIIHENQIGEAINIFFRRDKNNES